MLEIIGNENRRTVGLFDDALEGVELGGMRLLPVTCVVDIQRAVRELQALLRAHRRVGRLDTLVIEDGEHLGLHRVVHLARHRRQVDVDRVHDRLVDVQTRDGQADVLEAFLDLGLRVVVGHEAVAVVPLAEPPLLEGAERAAEALALIEEPHLPPQILHAVGRRGACQADEAADVAVSHLPEGPRPAAALTQAEGLEARELVSHDSLEGPRVAQRLPEPHKIVVVRAVDVRVLGERALALLGRAADDTDAQVLQVRPFGNLLGPRRSGDAQRCQHQHGEDVLE